MKRAYPVLLFPVLISIVLCGCAGGSIHPERGADAGAAIRNSQPSDAVASTSTVPSSSSESLATVSATLSATPSVEQSPTPSAETSVASSPAPSPAPSVASSPAPSPAPPDEPSPSMSVESSTKPSVASSTPASPEPSAVPDKNASAGRTICLTFDDGPAWNNTPKVLEALKQAGVKATFFVCGPDVEDRRQLIKQAYDEGHAIGLHCMSHALRTLYATEASFFADFNALERMVMETTGDKPTLYRFPGGSNNSFLSSELADQILLKLEARGYEYVDWNVMGQDESRPEPEAIAQNVIDGCRARRGAKTVSIVLLHDSEGRYTTGDAVPIILETLLEDGYAFAPITDAITPVHFVRK